MTIQQLKDAIATQITTFFTSKSVATRNTVKKAVADFVILANDETWEDVTPAKLADKFVSLVIARVKNQDEKDAIDSLSYTDLDA